MTYKERIRALLNCTCHYNETNDGKAWNNKIQKYEDCECLEKIPELLALLSDFADEVIGLDDNVHMKINPESDEDLMITLGENANNRLRAEQRIKKNQLIKGSVD